MGSEGTVGGFFLLILLVAIVIFVWSLPIIIAVKRNHRNVAAIVVTDIIAIFILPVWLIALIWSFMK